MERIDDDVGIDWGSQTHPVCIRDGDGTVRGERAFAHSGASRADRADGIVTTTGAQPETSGIASEVPNGPVVDTRLDRGFALHSLNPKPLDRFRDRVSPAGAQDDRRDARVLAAALRTARAACRHRDPTTSEIIELREGSRLADQLTADRTRLANRAQQQLWRSDPQRLKVDSDRGKAWIRDLWTRVPTPAQAQTVRPASITRLLKRHRIRRIAAPAVLEILRTPAVTVAPGTTQAASAHLRIVFAQLDLIGTHITEAHPQIDRLIATRAESEDPTGIDTQRDVDILRSRPGVGRTVRATRLADADDPLRRRDDQALRCVSGVAPVTRRSGQSLSVVRRLAAHNRLRCARHHGAAVAVQHDTVSQAKDQALRERGHGHARALRSVADRRLAVACARLETQTLFDPARTGHNHAT